MVASRRIRKVRSSRPRARGPASSPHQGAAQGDAAPGGQADHPVRDRGGGGLGDHLDHHRDRQGQERDRGPLRRLLRAGASPRGARPAPAAGAGPRHLQHDQRLLRAPGGAARAGHAVLMAATWWGTSRSRDAGGRHHRQRHALHEADGERLRELRGTGHRGAEGLEGRDLGLRRHRRRGRGRLGRLYRIRDLVEKPTAAEAPSDLAIIGRYNPDPGHLRGARADPPRGRRRDTAHRRPEAPGRKRPLFGYHFEGCATTPEQAGLPEGGRWSSP